MAADRSAPSNELVRLERHGASYVMCSWPVGTAPSKIYACMRAGKPYEEPLLEHIYEQRFPGIAVDAGANIGNHTLWMAAVCGLEVVAFEPVWADNLHANVTLNWLGGRVWVVPVALGDADVAAVHVGRGRLRVGAGELPVRRLDDYYLDGVGLIKIDVEGMEPAVLRGGEATIRRDRPAIFAEVGDDRAHQAIARVLRPWGYRRSLVFRQPKTTVERWDPT